MAVMAKKKDKPKDEPAAKPKRTGVPVQAYLDPALRDAVEAFRKSHEFPPDISKVVVRALEAYLAERDFWPPSGESD